MICFRDGSHADGGRCARPSECNLHRSNIPETFRVQSAAAEAWLNMVVARSRSLFASCWRHWEVLLYDRRCLNDIVRAVFEAWLGNVMWTAKWTLGDDTSYWPSHASSYTLECTRFLQSLAMTSIHIGFSWK